ncbi:TnsA endonuclease N-terminal domain-containing protein [Marinobacter sp. ST-43]|uniref:TnsA endonuclease N-terminal domain-containing protein n=1 Tax=Marinobacter sp. ST-43 TaxID=3050453 RepID=UPI0026DFA732|nr:TnsA endonuclease N-terminal domain-containing protein [Marinobacter sp. ST-43]
MQQRELVKQSPIRSSYLSYSAHYGRVYALESTLELDYLNLIRFEKTADSVESQPFSIQFQLGGRPRRYTPDFLVHERGVEYVDEVKTRSAANKPEFRLKAEELTRFFRNRGQIFRVLTEDDIRPGHRAQNLRFLTPVLDLPSPIDEFETLLNATDRRSGSMTEFRGLLDDLTIDHSFIRRAVAHHLLQCDLTKPWSQLDLTW